jgi:hypothetical protein
MRVLLVIGMVVVPTMDGYPQGRRELQRERAEDGERVLEPKRDREAAVRYKAVEAQIDPKNAKDEGPDSEKDDSRPAEEPGEKCQESERMTEDESD